MNDIKFTTNGYKIPLTLEVEVDGISVTYDSIKGGIEFSVWTANRDKALEVVNRIVDEIIRERSDYKHFVSWRTESLEVVKDVPPAKQKVVVVAQIVLDENRLQELCRKAAHNIYEELTRKEESEGCGPDYCDI